MPYYDVEISGKNGSYLANVVDVKFSDLSKPGAIVGIKWEFENECDADEAHIEFNKDDFEKYFMGSYNGPFILKPDGFIRKLFGKQVQQSGNIFFIDYIIYCLKDGVGYRVDCNGNYCDNNPEGHRGPRVRVRDVAAKTLGIDYWNTGVSVALNEGEDGSVVRIYGPLTQDASLTGAPQFIRNFPSEIRLVPGTYRVVLECDGAADEEYELRVGAAPVMLVPAGAIQVSRDAGSGAAGA